jgi:hypothetical protein
MRTPTQMAMIARYKIALLIRPPLGGFGDTRWISNLVPSGGAR